MNKPKNTMKVSFPSRGANEGLARMLIAAFVTEADPTVEELCAHRWRKAQPRIKPEGKLSQENGSKLKRATRRKQTF